MGALRLKLKPEPEYRTNRLPVLQVLVLLLEVPISLPAHALGLLAGKSSPIADVESISKSMRSGGGKPELPEAVRTKFRPMAQQAMRMLPPKPLPDGLAGGSKPPRRNIGRRIGTALAWIWLLALFVGVPVWVSSLPPQRTSAPVSPPAPSPTPKNGVWHKDYDPPEARPLPPPAAYPPPHGTIFRAPSDEQVAPFSVTTSAGASYLVKLVRTYDDRDALVVFIVGGSSSRQTCRWSSTHCATPRVHTNNG